MKKVYIITGANGHLAKTIIGYLLKHKCTIRGLIMPNEEPVFKGKVQYYKGDVTDIESIRPLFYDLDDAKVYVIHTAGLISIAQKVSPKLYNVNVVGTQNVISLCQEYNVDRLCYVSSVHAIKETDGVIYETQTFNKDEVVGAYAKTKAEATKLVLKACDEGLDAVIVHPSGIIGPYDDGHNHIVQLIKMYISGKLPAGVNGGYDFVDVRDVAIGTILAANKGEKGDCYILSNSYYTIQQVLDYSSQITGGKKKKCLPMWLAKMFAPLFSFVSKLTKTRPLYTSYALYTLESNGHFAHEKASKKLGYKTRDFGQTIKDTIAYLKGNKVSLDSN